MDDVESRLRDVLGDPGRTVPPGDLADRVHRGVAVRRRRRRALALAAAACAVALAVAVPVAWRQVGGQGTTVANSVNGFGDLVDIPGSVAFAGETSDGGDFFPEAVGEDGSVLGRAGKGLWETGPEGAGPLRPLNAVSGAAPAIGPGVRVWPGTNFVAPLYCRDQNGTTTVMENMVGTPLWVSGGTIVGSDTTLRPWTAKGCAKGAAVPGASGEAVAFSYPDLFVVDPFKADGLRQVDVESGALVAERPLPEGVNVRTGADRWQLWLGAANRDTFAWVVDGVLRTADRADWRVTEGPRVPPAEEMDWSGRVQLADGRSLNTYPHLSGRLTAGDRLIVYTAGKIPGGWRSLVYDPRSGQSFEFQGVAYAAGDWLLWNDGASYRLARVR
ncbi:hypothetical protein [Nonomuraea sp. NEAU-A123]|uniref:hypothetical protein n=1 Tax=Nonomuraea sp. NEAU-A123 TaxID=2839649 RepID=UPI001BE3EEB3|nr:hypothetical protein [Nonomuraea sp. NEAU-A123]MBT2229242.1 hypothetical protein [Nonomuraea sp. NEAU-A123]